MGLTQAQIRANRKKRPARVITGKRLRRQDKVNPLIKSPSTTSAKDLVLQKARTPFTEQELQLQKAEAERAAIAGGKVSFGGGSFAGGAGAGGSFADLDPFGRPKPEGVQAGVAAAGVGLAAGAIAKGAAASIKALKGLKAAKDAQKVLTAKKLAASTAAEQKAFELFTRKAAGGIAEREAAAAASKYAGRKAVSVERAAATAVVKYTAVGATGLNPNGVGLGKTIASNTKTLKITTRWIAGIAAILGLSVTAVSWYKDVVGTKVFTGFMGQETIQILGFAVRTARENEDWENMQEAIDLNVELVTLMQSPEFITGLPYDEAIRAAKIFADAAELKNAIDQKSLDDKLIQIETGETEDEKFARIRQEQIDADIAQTERIAESTIATKKETLRLEAAADNATSERIRESLLERIELLKQADIESIKRAEDATIASGKFWAAYNLEAAKNRDSNARSQLSFGLLG